MARLISSSIALLFAQILVGQTSSDALRYSYLLPSGSARFVGAGASMGAVGADFGTLSTNPAGLALFRDDYFQLTPTLSFSSSTSTLRGAGNAGLDDDNTSFNFQNVGFVFHSEPRSSTWKTFNVGIGLNKQACFNQNLSYSGSGPGTLLNGWFADTKQVINSGGTADDLDPFGAQMAYEGYGNAIYHQNDTLSYDFAPDPTAVVKREQSIAQSGALNEMVLSFAGNYDEKLMVGATIGVPLLSYEFQGDYRESNPDQTVKYFDKLAYTEYVQTNAVGFNLKMGMIYKITPVFRVGLAVHTPTWMTMTDNYQNTFQYDYTDGSGPHIGTAQASPNGTFDYKLRTSWRAQASAAAVIRGHGFLNAEAEFVDYRSNRFTFTSDVNSVDNQAAERDVNNQIRADFKRTLNLRFGGELALGTFRLRAGLAMLGKPKTGATGFDNTYSLGVGVDERSFFLGLTWRNSAGTLTVQPYSDPAIPAGNQPVADVTTSMTDVLFTAGLRF